MSRTPLSRSRRISQERVHQRSGVLASAHARRLAPGQEGRRMAAGTLCDDGALAAGHSAAGTRRFRAAYLTVWGVPERRTDRMDVHMQMAEAVRQACIAAALQAYDEAGVSGLCHEGRWEYAVDVMRALPLRPLIEALLRVGGDERRDHRRGACKLGGDTPLWPPEHGRERLAAIGSGHSRPRGAALHRESAPHRRRKPHHAPPPLAWRVRASVHLSEGAGARTREVYDQENPYPHGGACASRR